MTERPIIFSAPMVRALLEGRKSQTRRILKDGWAPEHRIVSLPHGPNKGLRVIPYDLGDRLWVRESWADLTGSHGQRWEKFNPETKLYERGVKPFIWYRADGDQPCMGDGRPLDEPWRSPIHMPRWASRITLEVTEVRVQRLQDISEEDARAEGAEQEAAYTGRHDEAGNPEECGSYRLGFSILWNTINGPGAWDANPWVAGISFKRVQ